MVNQAVRNKIAYWPRRGRRRRRKIPGIGRYPMGPTNMFIWLHPLLKNMRYLFIEPCNFYINCNGSPPIMGWFKFDQRVLLICFLNPLIGNRGETDSCDEESPARVLWREAGGVERLLQDRSGKIIWERRGFFVKALCLYIRICLQDTFM